MKSDEISALSEDIRGLISAIQRGLFTNDVKCDRIEDTPCFEEWREHYAFPAIARAMFARGKVHLIEPLWMICKMQERIEVLCREINARQRPPEAAGGRGMGKTDQDGRKKKEAPITETVANGGVSPLNGGEDDRWWEKEEEK